jgi:DDE superfamily endonuclease
MWCIPPGQDAAFVCRMEQVLGVYRRPYDPRRPVVCMDEQPKQLTSEARRPLPPAPGRPARVDYEYVREGTCTVWMFVEPLGGWRDVRVTATRTALDWAHQVRGLVDDPRYAEAERITLVCDNLVTHDLASLYKAFEPTEALRLARKLELVPTPKHGSWLNIAESELGVLTRQSLDRRIAVQGVVEAEAGAWRARRNAKQVGVEWHFTTEDARIKLRHLYPKIRE